MEDDRNKREDVTKEGQNNGAEYYVITRDTEVDSRTKPDIGPSVPVLEIWIPRPFRTG